MAVTLLARADDAKAQVPLGFGSSVVGVEGLEPPTLSL
jgi:hypothetical protein